MNPLGMSDLAYGFIRSAAGNRLMGDDYTSSTVSRDVEFAMKYGAQFLIDDFVSWKHLEGYDEYLSAIINEANFRHELIRKLST